MKKHLLIGLILSVSLLVGCQSPGNMIAEKLADSANAKNEAVETVPQEPAYYDEQFLVTFAEAIKGSQDNYRRKALTQLDVLEIEKEAHDYYTTKTFKDPILSRYAANYLEALDTAISLVKMHDPDGGISFSSEQESRNYDEKYSSCKETIVNTVCALIDEYDLQLPEEYINAFHDEQVLMDNGYYFYLRYWDYDHPEVWYGIEIIEMSSEPDDDKGYKNTIKLKNATGCEFRNINIGFYDQGSFAMSTEDAVSFAEDEEKTLTLYSDTKYSNTPLCCWVSSDCYFFY